MFSYMELCQKFAEGGYTVVSLEGLEDEERWGISVEIEPTFNLPFRRTFSELAIIIWLTFKTILSNI